MSYPWPLFVLAFGLAWLTGWFSISCVSAMLFLLWCGRECWQRGTGNVLRPARFFQLLHFLYDFAVDLAVSNFVMAWDVLTPRDRHQVGLIRVPVEDLSAAEVAFLSHRITLTPGTLACGITQDGRFLLVHAMYPTHGEMGLKLRQPIDILKGAVENGI